MDICYIATHLTKMSWMIIYAAWALAEFTVVILWTYIFLMWKEKRDPMIVTRIAVTVKLYHGGLPPDRLPSKITQWHKTEDFLVRVDPGENRVDPGVKHVADATFVSEKYEHHGIVLTAQGSVESIEEDDKEKLAAEAFCIPIAAKNYDELVGLKLNQLCGRPPGVTNPSGYAMVILLLNNGANINAPDDDFGTVLQVASRSGNCTIVKLLIDRGADVNAQYGHYGNALQAASWTGNEESVQLLLDHGADVNARGGFFGNSLQGASWGGHRRIIILLFEHGADVNAEGGYYGNALQAASWRGHREIVKLLLKKGADVDKQGGYYNSAHQAALAGGHRRVQGLLRFWSWHGYLSNTLTAIFET